jgi:ferredoxin
MTVRRLRVTVDPDICVGNAMCRAIAPGVFVETADGQSEVGDLAAGTPEAILEAAANCPVGAIFVEDADTNEPIEP